MPLSFKTHGKIHKFVRKLKTLFEYGSWSRCQFFCGSRSGSETLHSVGVAWVPTWCITCIDAHRTPSPPAQAHSVELQLFYSQYSTLFLEEITFRNFLFIGKCSETISEIFWVKSTIQIHWYGILVYLKSLIMMSMFYFSFIFVRF
jgi:hypothetical protein